jgi:hypothetical protein
MDKLKKSVLQYLNKNKKVIIFACIFLVLTIFVLINKENIKDKDVQIYGMLIYFATFIAIVWYAIETKKLRKLTQNTMSFEIYYKILNDYMEEYRALELRNDIPFEKIIYREPVTGQNYFYTLYKSFSTYWTGKIFLNALEANETNCKEIMELYLEENSHILGIEKYTSQIYQILLYLNYLRKNDIGYYEMFRTLSINKFNIDELHFLFYYGITNKKLIKLFNEIDIFKNIKSLKFLLNESHKNFYSSVLERFK